MLTSRTGRIVQAVATDLGATRVAAAGLRLLSPLERAAQRAIVAAALGEVHAPDASLARSADALAAWPGAACAAGALRDLLAPYDVDVQWSALGEMITRIQGADLAASPSPTPSPASPGPTELILRVLGEATAPLYACQIVEGVQAFDPCITPGHLNTVIYRLFKAGRVERSGGRCSYRYTVHLPPTAASDSAAPPRGGVPQQPINPMRANGPVVQPTDDAGLTEIMLAVLRSAGTPLTKPEINERVRQINPRYSANEIAGVLRRLRRRRADSPIVARGPKGRLKFSLRSVDDLPDVVRVVGPSRAANENSASGPEVLARIVAELAERPTAVYHRMVLRVYGVDNPVVRTRLRDHIEHLADIRRVRRRDDGVWEVPTVLH